LCIARPIFVITEGNLKCHREVLNGKLASLITFS
jgi:hypothetical protein